MRNIEEIKEILRTLNITPDMLKGLKNPTLYTVNIEEIKEKLEKLKSIGYSEEEIICISSELNYFDEENSELKNKEVSSAENIKK